MDFEALDRGSGGSKSRRYVVQVPRAGFNAVYVANI